MNSIVRLFVAMFASVVVALVSNAQTTYVVTKDYRAPQVQVVSVPVTGHTVGYTSQGCGGGYSYAPNYFGSGIVTAYPQYAPMPAAAYQTYATPSSGWMGWTPPPMSVYSSSFQNDYSFRHTYRERGPVATFSSSNVQNWQSVSQYNTHSVGTWGTSAVGVWGMDITLESGMARGGHYRRDAWGNNVKYVRPSSGHSSGYTSSGSNRHHKK